MSHITHVTHTHTHVTHTHHTCHTHTHVTHTHHTCHTHTHTSYRGQWESISDWLCRNRSQLCIHSNQRRCWQRVASIATRCTVVSIGHSQIACCTHPWSMAHILVHNDIVIYTLWRCRAHIYIYIYAVGHTYIYTLWRCRAHIYIYIRAVWLGLVDNYDAMLE